MPALSVGHKSQADFEVAERPRSGLYLTPFRGEATLPP